MVDRYGNPPAVITPNVQRELDRQGFRHVHEWEPGASQWCTGSGSFPEADPPQDSNGDCTECGEPLIWVLLADEPRDKIEVVERAVIYTAKPGDVVVLEVAANTMTRDQIDALQTSARAAFGIDVKIVVMAPGTHFAGVVRDSESGAAATNDKGDTGGC